MSTFSRLTQVFNAAKERELPFDDTSKIVLFSDCHRGDNSWADDFGRNQLLMFFALKRYFEDGFTYIEVGDGDELYENHRFEDIRKAHDHIFWLLSEFHRQKRLHLIHGNHDMEHKYPAVVQRDLYSYYDDREDMTMPLFDGIEVHEGIVLRHVDSGGRILLVHGHQGDFINDRLWRVGRFFVRHVWRPLQLLGFADPTSPAQNFTKRGKVEEQNHGLGQEEEPAPDLRAHTQALVKGAGQAPVL